MDTMFFPAQIFFQTHKMVFVCLVFIIKDGVGRIFKFCIMIQYNRFGLPVEDDRGLDRHGCHVSPCKKKTLEIIFYVFTLG